MNKALALLSDQHTQCGFLFFNLALSLGKVRNVKMKKLCE